MGVNIVDNASSQQMAVALSNSLSVELKQIDKKTASDFPTRKVEAKSDVDKLLQSGVTASKAGLDILAGLATKLATAGVSLKPDRLSDKTKGELEDELSQLFRGDEKFDDFVELNNVVGKAGEQKKQQGGKGQKGQDQALKITVDAKTQEAVKEYAALYSQYAVNDSQDIKKKLETLEKLLSEKGFTNKDLISIRTTVKNSMRQDVREQIKDAFFKKILTKEKSVGLIIRDKTLNTVLHSALLSGLHDNESLQGVADEIKKEMLSDLKDFTIEKMAEKLIGKHLAADAETDKKITNELKELLKLATKVGVNLNEFSQDWQVKKFDIGMFAPNIPLGTGDMDLGSQSKNKKNPYEFSKEDEKDLFINRLRAIYMHRAISGDMATVLSTYFKVTKLKNGLIKLGVSSDELKDIEKEGIAAARLRLVDMLSSALEERGTLYELAGPAFKLVEQKIKGILSNLKRLGWEIDETEFNSLRDSANIKVFDAAKDEFLSLEYRVKGAQNPNLEKRLSLILKLMKRLKVESHLDSQIPGGPQDIREAV